MTATRKPLKLRVVDDNPCQCGKRSTRGVHGCDGEKGVYSIYYCDSCYFSERQTKNKDKRPKQTIYNPEDL